MFYQIPVVVVQWHMPGLFMNLLSCGYQIIS